ncbi:MAG: hypothetical protein OIF32_11725 [Campylobacterales bacterium]|nr:hypothetical protein [Campylobacterales bacterium]
MKKNLLIATLTAAVVMTLNGCQGKSPSCGVEKKKSNKFRIDELVILPHPGKMIKHGQVKATKQEKMAIKKIKQGPVPLFQKKMQEAFKLEKKLQRGVAKGKTKEELKDLLDQIAKLKREAIDHRIDALNMIHKVVGEEKWKKINKLTYK